MSNSLKNNMFCCRHAFCVSNAAYEVNTQLQRVGQTKRKEERKMRNSNLLRRLWVEEEGQGVVEYSLMIGLVVVGIYAAISLLGIPASISALWTKVDTELKK